MPIRRLLRCFFFIITLYFFCVHIGTTVVMLYGRCKQHWAQERHLPISYTFLFISTASSFCYLFFDFFLFLLVFISSRSFSIPVRLVCCSFYRLSNICVLCNWESCVCTLRWAFEHCMQFLCFISFQFESKRPNANPKRIASK